MASPGGRRAHWRGLSGLGVGGGQQMAGAWLGRPKNATTIAERSRRVLLASSSLGRGGAGGKWPWRQKQSVGIRGSCHLSRTLLFPRAWGAERGPRVAAGPAARSARSYGERSSGNRGAH
ncbi:hypothetical protein MTO96_016713 [Rhipicephalus appendiculatus]